MTSNSVVLKSTIFPEWWALAKVTLAWSLTLSTFQVLGPDPALASLRSNKSGSDGSVRRHGILPKRKRQACEEYSARGQIMVQDVLEERGHDLVPVQVRPKH
jgi:hypothetical protein